MSASCTQTTTTTSTTAGPSRSRPVLLPPADPAVHEDKDFNDEDNEEGILWRAQEWVQRVRERKTAEAARKAARAAEAREKVARVAWERAHRAQQQEEEVTERRRLLAMAATARSQQGTSPSEVLVSPRRPVVKISKAKGKAKAQPVDEDPDDGDNDNDKKPCEQCRTKKISYQMQAARRRRLPPELPEAGPSGLLKKRRRVVDSDEEEEREIEGEMEKEGEEEEGEAPAPKKAKMAASEKGKEKEVK
ncbi:hypothetical protein GG344DRAFT_82606 [Lentinula edodes]|nr:hypothetical protein GG344DRAFT_82606 [Lentinula edodes]